MLITCVCGKCGNVWNPRVENPKLCPKCKCMNWKDYTRPTRKGMDLISEKWVCLRREDFESDLIKDHKAWALWCFFLNMARTERLVTDGDNKTSIIPPGSLLLNEALVLERLNLEPYEAWACLQRLEREGYVELFKQKGRTTVLVRHWDKYAMAQPLFE